jgi:hypothetical protein
MYLVTSVDGTNLPNRHVRSWAAARAKPDMTRTAHLVENDPMPDMAREVYDVVKFPSLG